MRAARRNSEPRSWGPARNCRSPSPCPSLTAARDQRTRDLILRRLRIGAGSRRAPSKIRGALGSPHLSWCVIQRRLEYPMGPIVLVILGVFVAIIVIVVIATYNGLVSSRLRVDEAW